MNRLVLGATLLERGVLRYTPAGLPALDVVLKHESTVTENGQPRKVLMELRAVAIGTVTEGVKALALGQSATYGGFLAAARNGRGIVFHVTEVSPG